jgi:ubiquinone/menaquinone biosynthesis C-methylase UbiE
VGGGSYEVIGQREADLVAGLGLKEGMSLLDLGCGSGRLATQLGKRFGDRIEYLGIDVVQVLLDYAASRAPASYRFVLNSELRLPAEAASADMIVAFSVFTHLHLEESYRYLQDAARVMKPSGLIVFSFLEMDRHWDIFERRAQNYEDCRHGGLDMFIERRAIHVWASKLELELQFDVGSTFGQSTVALRRTSMPKQEPMPHRG